jgi:hypothetical protein
MKLEYHLYKLYTNYLWRSTASYDRNICTREVIYFLSHYKIRHGVANDKTDFYFYF